MSTKSASTSSTTAQNSEPHPTDSIKRQDLNRWRRYVADERAERAVYQELANRRTGDEREILLDLAEAERRHEEFWLERLGDQAGRPLRPTVGSRVLTWLARRFGSVFVLALMQRAESRSPYDKDGAASSQLAADEQIHEEVIRGLAAQGRRKMAGTFRAAIFGANDGLVSNLALVMGVGAAGASTGIVLVTGLAGLLAGALSMGAGEYVSVRSQRELLAASAPGRRAHEALADLNVDENELALVYRARGMDADSAAERAKETIGQHIAHPECTRPDCLMHGDLAEQAGIDADEAVGSPLAAAFSSFCFFASGAIIPIFPFLIGLSGPTALVASLILVGVALMITGATVGILSGTSPLLRGLRQLAIGYGAAAVTYVLGLLFGAHVS